MINLPALIRYTIPCLLFSLGFSEVNPSQRGDGCVFIDTSSVSKKEFSVDFELKEPGSYVVQVVHTPEEAGKELSASAKVGKLSLAKLSRKYWIEDGIVSSFTEPVAPKESGTHTIKVQCEHPPKWVRVVPTIYTKSRIMIGSQKYYPEWVKMHESAEKKAAMEWYQQAKFGMFIHWGLYSEAAGSWKGVKIEDSEHEGPKVAEWLMYTFQISREEYRELAKDFNPEKSFAKTVAELAKKTGMKYMVITSKHHDGFALFDSQCSEWDITDASPYKGDLIKELYDACQEEGVAFGVYYSHGHDWMDGTDANYAKIKAARDEYNVPTRINGKNLWDSSPNSYEDYLEKKAYPQVQELIEMMPNLRLIWFDGDGLITEKQAFRFYKMVYEMNPNIVVNRRVGYEYGDYMDAGDNRTPKAGELAPKYFETCGTANHSWGFKAYDHDWKTTEELLENFIDIISKGGNYLLNIGPEGDGTVPKPCADNFVELGKWVQRNGEAIYGSSRWKQFSESHDGSKEYWFSSKVNKVYVTSLSPEKTEMQIKALKKGEGSVKSVRLLGSEKECSWSQEESSLKVSIPETFDYGYVIEVTTD